MRTPPVQKYSIFFLFLLFLLPLGCAALYPNGNTSNPPSFPPSSPGVSLATSADWMDIDFSNFSSVDPKVRSSLEKEYGPPEIPLLSVPEKGAASLQPQEQIPVDKNVPLHRLPVARMEAQPETAIDDLAGTQTEPGQSAVDLYGGNDPGSQLLSLHSQIKREESALRSLFGSPFFSPAFSAEEEGEANLFGRKKPISDVLTLFPSLLHEKVRHFVEYFQTAGEDFFSVSLARSQAYESMMKKILREKNLPEEFFYLALIESGFNPRARSKAKATGIWQLMAQTARRFGLQVNRWIDERRDPEKSTRAAAEYLKSLYEIFQSWELATASYNAGEGKVLLAMKKTNSQDFWEISRHHYLKQETKRYVPKFLAAVTIARDPRQFGFSKTEDCAPIAYEKVLVPPGTRLDRIARAAQTDLATIRSLNPALLKWKTPPNGSPMEIRIPAGKKEAFEKNFHLKQTAIASAKKHRILPGETLWYIAKKYRISLQDLCEFNQIAPQALLRPGLTLLVPP
jgi:LysM repeat protein